MNKFKNYLATPITWGAYWKFSLICAALSGAISWMAYKICMAKFDEDYKNEN